MPNHDIVIKKVEPIRVASVREKLPNYSSVGQLFDELIGFLPQHEITNSDYCAAIWHDLDCKECDVDAEAVILVDRSVPETDRIKIYDLPEYDAMACIIHKGSYRTLSKSYKQLLAWIETNGYQIIGPNREFYIQGGQEDDNESYVTEIQIPVEKA